MKREAPRQVNRFFQKNPTPSGALLELTNRCNQRCDFCARTLDRADVDLPVDAWKQVLDEIAALGALAVCFSGGEPLLIPKLADLIRHAREKRLAVAIKTNGTLLEERLDELVAAGVGALEVSLLGASAASHDRKTGLDGSFTRMTAGVSAARRAGVPVILMATLFRETANDAGAIITLAEHLDCALQWNYLPIEPDRGASHDFSLPTPGQIRSIEAIRPVHSCGVRPRDGVAICLQGVNRLAVTSRGDILPCVTIRQPIGRIEDGISVVWKRFQTRKKATAGPQSRRKFSTVEDREAAVPPWSESGFTDDRDRSTRCDACVLRDRCLPCPGRSLAATGSIHEPALEHCYVTMAIHATDIDNVETQDLASLPLDVKMNVA